MIFFATQTTNSNNRCKKRQRSLRLQESINVSQSKHISNNKLHFSLAIIIILFLLFLALPLRVFDYANEKYKEKIEQSLGQCLQKTSVQKATHGDVNNLTALIRRTTNLNRSTTRLMSRVKVTLELDERLKKRIPNWETNANFQRLVLMSAMHCPLGMFVCLSCTHICLSQSKLCDGRIDCPDLSDETSACHDSTGAVSVLMSNIIDTDPELASSSNNNNSSNNINMTNAFTFKFNSNSNSSKSSPYYKKPAQCSHEQYAAKNCPCNLYDDSYVWCRDVKINALTKLSKFAQTIKLRNNSLCSIDNVEWPSTLTYLIIEYNCIKKLNKETFINSPKLDNIWLTENKISFINENAFKNLNLLLNLDLSRNNLTTFNTSILKYCLKLKNVYLQENQISLPYSTNFSSVTPNLNVLLLNSNRLTIVRQHWFSNLKQLVWLSLANNLIETIEYGSFSNNINLTELKLSNNKLLTINKYTFSINELYKLDRLELANNNLLTLQANTFELMPALRSLNLTGMLFASIDSLVFSNLSLTFIAFERFRYCVQFAAAVPICKPITDGVSSSGNLLAYPVLKLAVWIVAIVCTLGNSCVLVWRTISSRENETVSIFVRNLSIADLMMGIYLTTIAIMDVKYNSEFGSKGMDWMSSSSCALIGVLAVWSSVLSVFILTIITIERYRSIVSRYKFDVRRKQRQARIYLALAWICSLIIATYPHIAMRLQQSAKSLTSINSSSSSSSSTGAFGDSSPSMRSLLTQAHASLTQQISTIQMQREEARLLNATTSNTETDARSSSASLYARDSLLATNALCLPLHIDDPYLNGWQYSAFVYLAINFVAVLIICSLYAHMYIIVVKRRQLSRPAVLLEATNTKAHSTSTSSRSTLSSASSSPSPSSSSSSSSSSSTSTIHKTMNKQTKSNTLLTTLKQQTNRKTTKFKSLQQSLTQAKHNERFEDAILAVRFFFIVITGCLCWTPIVIIKLVALFNVRIPEAMNGWLTVFIIPINSALNPIVYTLAAPTVFRSKVCSMFANACRRFDELQQSLFGKHMSKKHNNRKFKTKARVHGIRKSMDLTKINLGNDSLELELQESLKGNDRIHLMQQTTENRAINSSLSPLVFINKTTKFNREKEDNNSNNILKSDSNINTVDNDELSTDIPRSQIYKRNSIVFIQSSEAASQGPHIVVTTNGDRKPMIS